MQWGNKLDRCGNFGHMFDMLDAAQQAKLLDFLFRAEIQALGHIEALAPSHFRAIFPPCYYRQEEGRSNVIHIDAWQHGHSVEKIHWGGEIDRAINLMALFDHLDGDQQRQLLDFTYRKMVQAFGSRAEFVPVSTPAHCRGWMGETVSNVIEISAGRRVQ